jgi:prepilin-type N-terminal cleavage/methylation domain-containing protein/prepilin-type processing-associated H-X9-DG protein
MKSPAFTLIELLVVISILAMLMAIVFPVFASSRQQAQTIACRTNIRELLLALHSYETECQSLPYGFDFRGGDRPPGGYIGNCTPGLDKPGWWWFHFAGILPQRFRKEGDVLRCPAKKLDDAWLDRDVLCGNYGANRSLCRTTAAMNTGPLHQTFTGAPLSSSNLYYPGATLLLVDSGYSLISWWQATAEPPVPLGDSFIEDTAYIPGLEINRGRSLRPGQTSDAIGGRHPNKTVNIGFADSHADGRQAGELLVEKTENGSYTNALLWHIQETDAAGAGE